MKRLILVSVFVGLVAGGMIWKLRQADAPAVEPTAQPTPTQEEIAQKVEFQSKRRTEDQTRQVASVHFDAAEALPAPQVAPAATPVETNATRKIAVQLVSPRVSFQEKEALWKQLREKRKLDEVLAMLEQNAADNPTVPEYRTAIGQACIQKIYANKVQGGGNHQEAAILGLKADQNFDAALELDPSNWEAQFFKAYSMSYWPEEMNKRQEVVERFTALIEQQEKMASQPHFAQSYVLLGEQYQKAGYTDHAKQVWRRGAVLYPTDSVLRNKLTSSQ